MSRLQNRNRSTAPVNAARFRGCTRAAAAALCASAVLGGAAIAEQAEPDRAALLASLPQASALPAGFPAAGELAGRGVLHTAGGQWTYRQHDGGDTHGSDSLPIWERRMRGGAHTQGAVFGVEEGAVVSTGYLVRQADLAAGNSFRNLSLRGEDFPAPQHLTVDFIASENGVENAYLLLWHFLPLEGEAGPTLPLGPLPPVTSLPDRFTLYACEEFPEDFCPRMGRHHRDLSGGSTRLPAATGDDSVIYGEAAGKLIFIEYVFRQQDLMDGVSWPAIPLNGLPIPPINNLHLLHYNGEDGAPGRYTAHMYFVPEKTYLSWDRQPTELE